VKLRRPPSSRLHLWATVVWSLAVIPTLLWWRDSVLWVLIASLWANVVSHASAYEAARAKEIAVNSGGDSS
jgi:hypothetical protein